MITAQFASLVSGFNLTIPEILALTPRQIAEIYGHPRDEKTGAVIPPRPPAVFGKKSETVEQLRAAYALASALKVPPETLAALRKRIEEAGRDPGTAAGTTPPG